MPEKDPQANAGSVQTGNELLNIKIQQSPNADANYERNLQLLAEREAEIRHRLLADSIKVDEAAKQLRITPEEVIDRVAKDKLLALLDGKDYFFPVWQFDTHTPDGLVQGFVNVQIALKTSDMPNYAIASWLSSPNMQLDGKSPLDILKEGDIEEVLWAVNTLLEH